MNNVKSGREPPGTHLLNETQCHVLRSATTNETQCHVLRSATTPYKPYAANRWLWGTSFRSLQSVARRFVSKPFALLSDMEVCGVPNQVPCCM